MSFGRIESRRGRRAIEALLDGIFALRPLLWIPAVAVWAAGRSWSIRARGGGGNEGDWAPLGALLLILAAVHAANAWRDREGDRRNEKGLALRSGRIGGAALLVLGLLALLGAWLLAMRASAPERILLASSLLLGAAYVTPPVELKRRAGLDLAAQGLGYGVVAFLLGAAGRGAVETWAGVAPAIGASIPYALGVLSVSLLTMLADRIGDESVGQRTTAVVMGPRRAAGAALALAWGAFGAGLAALDLVPALWGLVGAAGISLGSAPEARPAREWNALAIRLQLVFLALFAPLDAAPLVAAILVGVAAEGYFRWRWGISYPLRALGERGSRISEGRAST